MDFPQRLASLRKLKSISQNQLADALGLHVSQVRRYERGSSQPTLEVLRKMSQTLEVSADMLVFGNDERGPDEALRLQFDAVKKLDPNEKEAIKAMIEGIILRHEAQRWPKTG